MSSEQLSKIPIVDIDPEGIFKYILIQVSAKKNAEMGLQGASVVILRGYKRFEYHGDIFDDVDETLKPMGFKLSCLGGGRINHDPAKKKILVYGYSQGYGKANHEVAVDMLKKKYLGYDITWSDEGY